MRIDSTLLVTQLIEAVAHSLTNTKSTEEPVVGVSTIVVDGSTIALVIPAVLASWG